VLGVVAESAGAGNRQMTMIEASASIAESSPNPSSATELAMTAAVMAIARSAVM
jgi:hypothetical protein